MVKSLIQLTQMPCAIATCGLLLVCVLCGGCSGNSWQADTFPARGTVSLNTEPPAGAVVELHPVGEQNDIRRSRPWAIVKDDGSYTLSTYQPNDGAPAGEYAITLRWPPDASQPSFADRLGGAYATAQRSNLTATISQGENVIPEIKLENVKVQPKEAANTSGRLPPGPAMGSPRK